jgi:cytochrome c-type biogenesis protein CcmH
MIVLVIAAALLSAAAVWFLLRPLARAAPAHEGRHQLAQLRDRLLTQLRELDMEAGDANIDAATAADERLRLETELARVLKELDSSVPPGPAEDRASDRRASRTALRLAIAALAVLVPLASAGLYFTSNRGTLVHLAHFGLAPPAAARVPPQVQEMVTRLEQRLATQPDDSKGWAMLGRSYEVLGRPHDADRAYANAHRLAPNDVDILAAYAGFLASLRPTAPSPQAVALFRKLLARDPRHPAALWTLGLAAFHEGKFREAQGYWERLLKELPADSEVTPQITRALQEARAAQQRR